MTINNAFLFIVWIDASGRSFPDAKLIIFHDSWIYYRDWLSVQTSVLDRGSLEPDNEMMSTGVALIWWELITRGKASCREAPLQNRWSHRANLEWELAYATFSRDEMGL